MDGIEDGPEQIVEGITEDPDEIVVLVSDGARRFIAEHGGELYVWVSVHGLIFPMLLLEASTERPQAQRLFFRRRRVKGLDLMLQADRRIWPLTLDIDLCSHGKKVCAYWNGLAFVA